MVSHTAAEDQSYAWSGTPSGQVGEDGNLAFIASNGCRMKGLAEPKFGRWAGPLEATGCNAGRLNAAYDAVITIEHSGLLLNARSVVLGSATVVSEMRAEMQVPDTDAAKL